MTARQFQFKYIAVGSTAAGKTSLIIKFADDLFVENYHATIGIDFVIQCVIDRSSRR